MKTREKKQLWRASLFMFVIIAIIYAIIFFLLNKRPPIFNDTSRLWDIPLIFVFILSATRLWQLNYIRGDEIRDIEDDNRKTAMLILLTFSIILGPIGVACDSTNTSIILTAAVGIIIGFFSKSINTYALFYGILIGLINCFSIGAGVAILMVVVSEIAYLLSLIIVKRLFTKNLGEWLSGES